MKKILLSLCLFVAASAGQAFAAGAAMDSNDNIVKELNGNKRFTVQVSTGEGGQIEIFGYGAVSKNSVASAVINTGEDVELIITPDAGYVLKTLYVDGVDVLENVAEGKYTITALSKNMSVSATFEAAPDPKVPGDVNEDDTVGSADVVAVYNYILIAEDSGVAAANADVNGDAAVGSADIVALYNIILGGSL